MSIVITGGGSGIGRALAKRLSNLGEEVIIVGRKLKLLQETAHQSSNILVVESDLTTNEGRTKLGDFLQSKPKIKALVQNAGTIVPITPLKSLSLEALRQTQAINLEAPLALLQLLKEKLVGGRVLHLSSAMAHYPQASWGAYCITKAAFFMLYQLAKVEMSEIHFGSVMPGITDTAMQGLIREAREMEQDQREFFVELHKAGKLLKPETVAEFLAWLLLSVDTNEFSDKEWDIYDESHHLQWLKEGRVMKVFENE